MSFISNFLLKRKSSLLELPKFVQSQTQATLDASRHSVNDRLLAGNNWLRPDPINTLLQIDKVSNECCKVIDSAHLVYRQFGGGAGKEELRRALAQSIDEINTYFGELNSNKRLLTLLQYIECDHELHQQLDHE